MAIMLGERVLAERNVVIGRRLHDVSIEDVGVQDCCSVVVVKVGRVFRVGLDMMLVKRVVKLVLNRRVCWACLLVREPVACSSKGHAGAERVDKCTSVQTVTVRAGDRGWRCGEERCKSYLLGLLGLMLPKRLAGSKTGAASASESQRRKQGNARRQTGRKID